MGTVGYMSPEQAQGRVKEIDQRSDIFSFGCILFEAATGRKAFEGKDVLDSLHHIVHAPTPQIKEINPDAPDELQRIVRRCLAKDPDERYQSIKEVAIELKEVRRELENRIVDTTTSPELQNQTTSPPPVANSTRSLIDSLALDSCFQCRIRRNRDQAPQTGGRTCCVNRNCRISCSRFLSSWTQHRNSDQFPRGDAFRQ